jgi:uncharacterized protein (TIGR04255 family)
MVSADTPLPSYSSPPVVEVVVGVAFRPIPQLTVVDLSAFWSEKLKSHFPKVQQQPPYMPPVEAFGGPSLALPMVMQMAVPYPRLWFLTDDEQELVQVQRDYFACNWRKVNPASEYGRWPGRRKALVQWFDEFVSFIKARGFGELDITQCELTYIDHVPTSDVGSKGHEGLDRIMRLAGLSESKLLGSVEQVTLSAAYVIPDDSGAPVGRLHVDVQPGYRREDNAPIYVLSFTSRGRPVGTGLDGILRFLDRGRVWAVTAFADLTTDLMQKKWGRHE